MKKQLQKMMKMLMTLTLCCGFITSYAQPCNPNADFTATDQGNCCWLFTDNTPDMPNAALPMCDYWEIYDPGGNLISSGNSGTSDDYIFCFTSSGIFTVCNTDCCLDINGVLQTSNVCVIVSVTGCGSTPCVPDPSFTIADIGGCCYQFTANAWNPACAVWVIYDSAGNIFNSGAGPTNVTCFAGLSGTFTICYTSCCTNSDGTINQAQSCQLLTVNCFTPCVPDPTFAVADLGNCCYRFDDLTPNPVPGLGCEHWTIYQGTTVITTGNGPSLTWCFSLSGTYQICFDDCCMNSDGSIATAQTCLNLTVSCSVPCVPDANFSITDLGNCCYQLQDLTPGTIEGCEKFEWYEVNTPANISAVFTDSHTLCFTPAQNGTYVICYTDCCLNSDGTYVFATTCQTIVVNCVPPCDVDPTFTITNTGNCCYVFTDNTPDGGLVGVPNCDYWEIEDSNGNTIASGYGDSITHCFSASGTYTICNTDCCFNSDGTIHYETYCQTIYVSCGCCVPYSFSYNVMGCGVCITPLANCPLPDPNTYITVDWGDGSGTSTALCHTYTISGTYNICMTSCCINADGSLGNCVTHCKQVTVSCGEPCVPEVYFDFLNWGEYFCCVDVVAINPVLCVDPNDPTSVTVDVNGDGQIDILDWQLILDNHCCSFDFGDGSGTVYGPGPHHHCYNQSGYFMICYTACCIGTDGVLYSETLCKEAYFDCPPCAVDPTFIVTQGINPCCYIFDDLTPDFAGAFGCNLWEVFDANNNVIASGNGESYTYCFTANGTYTVCNTDCCINNDGTINTQVYCQTIVVDCFCEPDASFILTDLGDCCFTVTGNSCPTIVTGIPPFQNDGPCCSLDWGDGSPVVYGAGPHTHCFPINGVYNICYTTCCVNSDGTITYATSCQQITANCCCLPEDIITTVENCTVCVEPVFPTWCAWPTTDWWVEWGGTGTLQGDSCFVYDNPGTYIVCLYACCYDGIHPCDPVGICDTVTVNCCCLPTDFTGELGNCTGTFWPIYNCDGVNNIFWDFGDGTTATGNNPTHTFPGTGTYHVCMTACCCAVVNADGTTSNGSCITICQDVYVICDCIDPGLIDPTVFCTSEYNPVCGCDGVTYQNACVAQLNYGVTSWTLGPCEQPCCEMPTDISGAVNGCCVQFALVNEVFCCFNGSNLVTYLWNFGDSNTSTSANPYHCYANSGTYTVTLTSSCVDGSQVIFSMTVTVSCPIINPCDDLNSSFVFEESGLDVQFYSTSAIPSTDLGQNLNWNFGDGTISSVSNPNHLYLFGGAYDVSLTVSSTDADTGTSCSDTFTWTVIVESECPGDLDGNGAVNVGDLLTFMSFFGDVCD